MMVILPFAALALGGFTGYGAGSGASLLAGLAVTAVFSVPLQTADDTLKLAPNDLISTVCLLAIFVGGWAAGTMLRERVDNL